MTITLTVKGMHCKSCKMLIEDELEDLGAENVNVSVDETTQTGTVRCEYPDKDVVVKAIQELGEYTVK